MLFPNVTIEVHRSLVHVTGASKINVSFFRAVSYPVTWTWRGKAEKFENNEIHCNKQHRTDLLHGKAVSTEDVCKVNVVHLDIWNNIHIVCLKIK